MSGGDESKTEERPWSTSEGRGAGDLELIASFVSGLYGELGRSLPKGALRLGSNALRGGMSLLRPENLERAAEAGRSLRDAREVAGLTLEELSEAMELQDESFLEAVEKGTATLSFELILRLASLLARHDPVPFVMRYLRTYDPAVWQFLHDWGLGRLPLAYERERRFINIYRKHDAARALDDEAFQHLVEVTERAFHLSLDELTARKAADAEVRELREALVRERAALESARSRIAALERSSMPAPEED
ncbi:MAG: XRE family transcriptional regulator [Myxococcota bacterium]